MSAAAYMDRFLEEVLDRYPNAKVGFIFNPMSGTYFVKASPVSFFNDENEEWLYFSCAKMEEFNVSFEQEEVSMSFIPPDYANLEEYSVMTKELAFSSDSISQVKNNMSLSSIVFSGAYKPRGYSANELDSDTNYAMAA